MPRPGFAIAALALAIGIIASDQAMGQVQATSPAAASSGAENTKSPSLPSSDQQASVDVSFMSMHPPEYPREALANGIEGEVSLLVLVDPGGHAAAISIEYSSGNPHLDTSAVAAAWKWQFHPALNHGVARASLARVPVDFRIGSKSQTPRLDLPGGSEQYVQTDKAAIADIEKAATDGSADAQTLFAAIYFSGVGVVRDQALALQWYQKAAAQGYLPAYLSLAKIYALGTGVTADGSKAIEWYEKAAAKGSADAEFGIAQVYGQGYGLTKDPAKAGEWFEKAGTDGNAMIKLRVAAVYGRGDGVPKDQAHASQWLEEAAQQGNDDIKLWVGGTYFGGVLVTRDLARARAWFEVAAAHGDSRAQGGLAWMYAHGEGADKDATKALKLYQESAAQGNPRSQNDLALIYCNGTGTPRDEVLAWAWSTLARKQGESSMADTQLFQMMQRMKPEQVAEANRLAGAWAKGKVLVRETGGSP